MALVKTDLGYHAVIISEGSNYAYRLVDYVWVTVNGTDVRYWIVTPGSIRTGDFVASTDPETTTLLTETYIITSFDKKWKKDDRFKDGDLLVTGDGENTFLYRKVDGVEKVWKLTGNSSGIFQSSLHTRESEYGTLKKIQRGWSGEDANFSNMK